MLLVLRFSFGVIALIVLLDFIFEVMFRSYFASQKGGSRMGGIPWLFMIILGIISLYYAVKKIK